MWESWLRAYATTKTWLGVEEGNSQQKKESQKKGVEEGTSLGSAHSSFMNLYLHLF
jgi:hypothetical protein